MKRFFWIPFSILLGVFSATLVNAAVTDRLVGGWCAALDEIQRTAQAEDWPGARSTLSAVHRSWDEHATYFHIILQHDELNEAEALLAQADSFALAQDEAEFRACLAGLIAQLRVLSEMQEISIPNIL